LEYADQPEIAMDMARSQMVLQGYIFDHYFALVG